MGDGWGDTEDEEEDCLFVCLFVYIYYVEELVTIVQLWRGKVQPRVCKVCCRTRGLYRRVGCAMLAIAGCNSQ